MSNLRPLFMVAIVYITITHIDNSSVSPVSTITANDGQGRGQHDLTLCIR